MPLPQFNIKIPPTKKFKCWLATTGGHCDHVIVSLKAPSRKKDEFLGGLVMPDDYLSIGLSEFLVWFCDDKPDALIALGLLKRYDDGGFRPQSTRVEKWVRAEIILPAEEVTGTTYGQTYAYTNVYGLDLDDQFG